MGNWGVCCRLTLRLITVKARAVKFTFNTGKQIYSMLLGVLWSHFLNLGLHLFPRLPQSELPSPIFPHLFPLVPSFSIDSFHLSIGDILSRRGPCSEFHNKKNELINHTNWCVEYRAMKKFLVLSLLKPVTGRKRIPGGSNTWNTTKTVS
jgi:hypothetical protein